MNPHEHGKLCKEVRERLRGLPDIDLSCGEASPHVVPSRDLASFLEAAEALSRIVASVHALGVTHRDIRPENIGVREGRLALGGFGFASTFSGERPRFGPLDRLPRLPVFTSPEQTGRMNRPVDQRSDLYSLGATLYALAAGRPPFNETEALDLVHAHLARMPPPPEDFAPWMPHEVSRIIMRLLAKEPDDRYQSAAGVASDLRDVREALAAGRALEDLHPGDTDLALSPRAPLRQHGREDAIAELAGALESVILGGASRVFIRGDAGVGKTSLADELQRPVTLARGYFARGKFEQFQRQRPLRAPAEALGQLCEMLLAEPEETLAPLRRGLLAKMGPDAGALRELAPSFGALLGPAPAPAKLAPRESQVRTRLLLAQFLGHVASPERPIVIVLDDLQWADQPSIDLLVALAEDPDLDGLLLVGTYRDSEVDAEHPLQRLVARAPGMARDTHAVHLSNLSRTAFDALIADMLSADVRETAGLAGELFRATDGNPFYAIELVSALHREGVLRRDPQTGRWAWDASGWLASDNVVDFITRDLSSLPAASADVLATAACLGIECTLGLLERATGEPRDILVDRLEPALERGVLVLPDATELFLGTKSASVRFCHDRAQQAALQLRDEGWRSRLHLSVARRFAADAADALDRFRAAEHYADALELLEAREEKDAAASLFLSAARTAREAGASAEAERLLRLGEDLLAPDPWERAPGITWALHEEHHLACYGLSDYAAADDLFAQLERRAPGPEQLVAAACVQVMSLSNRSRYDEALRLGASLLARLGILVPLDNPEPDMERELAEFVKFVDNGALERLPGRSGAPEVGGAAKLMNRMVPAAFFTRPAAASWLVVRCARQWVEKGYDDALVYPMCCVLLATVPSLGDYGSGYRAARAALAAGAAAEGSVETARARHVFALFNCHWFEPLERALPHAREAHDVLLRTGELEFACYTYFTSQAALFDTAAQLDELAEENARAVAFASKTGNRHAQPAYAAFGHAVRALAGDGQAAEPVPEPPETNPMGVAFHHTYRALEAAIFGNEEALALHASRAVAVAPYITGFYPLVLAKLFESLALVGSLRRGEGAAARARLSENQRWLDARAADSPQNFLHLHDFIEAETLAAEGHGREALEVYERAMRRAKAHLRPWHLALITERAAKCYVEVGLEQAGHKLVQEACSLYARWGAAAKVASLEKEFPFLSAPGRSEGDVLLLLGAAQSLAELATVPRLIERTAEILSRVAGATDVLVLTNDESGRWSLSGGMLAGASLGPEPLVENRWSSAVPASVVRLGLRSLRAIASDDAVIDARFARDPHFAGLERCALLGVPVLVRGKPVAFLVLENRSIRGAFTPALASAVEMLCGQMAVALENARIRGSLEKLVEQRTKELREAERTIAQTAYELTENIPVGTYTMVQPADGGMAYFSFLSKRFLELTGLDAARARENPMNAFACVHPEDHEKWVRENAYVFEHKLPFHQQCRIVIGGETRWIVAESTPREMPDGSVVWEGVLTDITERKEAEQKLAESEARLRLILNNIPVPVAINSLRAGGPITFLNHQFTQVFGYTLEDIPTVGRWGELAYPDEDYRNATFAIWDTEVERARRTGGTLGPMEFRVSCKDGSRRDVLINAVAVEEMLLVGFVDITARKKAEEELVEANRNMQLAAAAASLGFWEYDCETGISKWDDEMLHIHGLARSEFDGDWLKHVHPEDRAKVADETSQVLASAGIFEMEFRIVRKNGEVRHVRDHGMVLRDSLGRALRANGVLLDITDQKEAALREKRMEEEHRRQLETKLKTSLTASAIAHEINQPLSSILLQSRMALKKDADARESLAVVAKQAQRMVATIEKMKALLRNVQTEHTTVDLAQVVKSSLLYTKGPIARAGVKVRQSGLRKKCFIAGDDAQMQLAVVNLLRNAVESIVQSGAERKEISIKLLERGGAAELVIGDSGPGWSGAELEETPLTTTKAEGTGIGLYVVRTAVKNHGGTIAFGRSPLGGAEVRLSFRSTHRGGRHPKRA